MNSQAKQTTSKFNPINILQYFYKNQLTVHLQLVSNFVTWNLYYIDGALQYANHSLQSLDTLEYYLSRLAPHLVGKIIPSLKSKRNINKLENIELVYFLCQKEVIDNQEKNLLINELTQDTLESFLWLQEGEYRWEKLEKAEILKIKNMVGDNVVQIPSMVKSLRLRHQLWQKVSKLVKSPYQRPLFVNIVNAQKTVPQGKLSPRVLAQLAKLVNTDTTIRDMATFLKQDELKIISLLAPYIQRGVIRLQTAKYPYNNLPSLPSMEEEVMQSATPSVQPQRANVIAKSVKADSNGGLSSAVDSFSEQNKYKIICIDDSETMLATIKDYLQGDYFEVVTVENPIESLSYLFESKPDLILMDLSMPKINGNRLSQILKSSSMFKNVPIIIVSGNHKMLDAEKMESIGAKDFLPKPFSQMQLLNIVNKHLQPNYSALSK
ncbi:two component signal transduction system twitching motility response regualator PilG [Cyanobacterium sp. HL-69]|uniref:response regulator n=1 Tax=Cyanobacterium sp. HL-69 TaxID=2054282 RepID=UPI000CA2410C|nr:two component signal transduction system twitching motility response regualator PilG [Cyanobacterium sp. HL-69]